MKYTISQYSSTPDPWEDFERQRKYDNFFDDEDIEPEEDVDDVEEDDYSDDDVE